MRFLSGWRKALVTALCLMLFFSSFLAGIQTVKGDESDEKQTIDYILILDCTVRAVRADEEGTRKAAAKMFVDLLPVDNARVAVFKIGTRDVNAQNRKAESAKSYKLRADNNHVADALYRMQCVYQLWDFDQPISDVSQRDQLKGIIDSAYVQEQGSNSDTHCAAYAAIDTLKYWDSQNACILLVSEEFTAFYNQHKVAGSKGVEQDSDHTMWDDVQESLARNRNWVLNWVDLGKDSPQLRTTITRLCKQNGGEASYDFEIAKLPDMIASVISKYAARDYEPRIQTLDSAGRATIELPSFIMLTEANIVVTGDGVDKVTIKDGKGSVIDRQKDDIWFSTNFDPEDASHFLYSAVKMIRPENGQWTVNVEGKAGTQVYVQAIHTLEPDLRFSCHYQTNDDGMLGVGANLRFTAAYQYAGEDIHCGNDAYEHYMSGAKLRYIHSSNPGTFIDISDLLHVESEQYIADFKVQERGTYSFYFYVESNDFQSGIRTAKPIENITVENHAPKAVGTIADLNDVPVGSTLDGIANIFELFTDDDNEELSYVVECKKNGRPADNAEFDLGYADDGFLSMSVPDVDGTIEVTVYAEDMNKAQSEPVTFTVHVVNEGPKVVKEQKETIQMIANPPELLVSLGLLPKEDCKVFGINVWEMFQDPEQLPLEYSVGTTDLLDEDGNEILNVQYDQNTGELKVSGTAKGQSAVVLTAKDSAGATASTDIHFAVRTVGSELTARYWWVPVVILVIILIILALLASRRVQGRWNVEVEDIQNKTGCSHSFTSLPASRDRLLKKTKVSLLSIIKCAVRKEDLLNEIQTNALKEKTIIFRGSLGLGKGIKFDYSPNARTVVSIDDSVISKSGKMLLKKNQVLEVACKDVDDSDVLNIKVSFH